MDQNSSSLDIIEDGSPHSLLEPPSPAYSNVTVRRAFIVWMYCGQSNNFKDVCNYYHHLETLEDKLPLAERAASRHHEFNMFSNPPPSTPYIKAKYPKLYSTSHIEPHFINKLESIKNEKCIFKLEGFNEIRQKGVTATEILETSQIIRKYCNSRLITLRKFLEEYKEYANKCGLTDTVSNVASYIKRKMVRAELEVIANYPQNFSFLNTTNENANVNESVKLEVNRKEESQTDEAKSLKILLGISNESNEKASDGRRYNSCEEFFKSFNNQNLKMNSRSLLTPSIKDFVKLFDQNNQKSRSVESLFHGKTSIVNSLNFSNRDYYDSNLTKLNELNKLRKI